MISELFEWDEDKAAANLRSHGIPFNEAVLVFRDPLAVETIDDRKNYGEERINILGMYRKTVLHVTYTEREGRIRIISARRAEKHEQEDYYRENTL
jgi:uncharacterized DUF497 family protein